MEIIGGAKGIACLGNDKLILHNVNFQCCHPQLTKAHNSKF